MVAEMLQKCFFVLNVFLYKKLYKLHSMKKKIINAFNEFFFIQWFSVAKSGLPFVSEMA